MVLTGVVTSLLCLFGLMGALTYLAFGPDIQPIVLLNLDAKSYVLQTVQLLYILAILLSVPITLFPAIRIMENGIFTSSQSGKGHARVKWLKNGFRTLLVATCTGISWFGAKDLDKFVAFVGCFASVPLCYIYPPLLHFKACAHTRKQKIIDVALVLFGAIVFCYTTEQTISLMLAADDGSPPKFGHCDKRP